jgi:hypothetical protein
MDLHIHLRNVVFAKRSEGLWYNPETQEIIANNVLLTRLNTGELTLDNVSNMPDVLPVFGNVQMALNLMPQIEAYLKTISDNKTVCYEAISGFRNARGSCFMDATLMAMFAFRNSPFNRLLQIQDFANDANRVCKPTETQDTALRAKIQTALRTSVEAMIEGTAGVCSQLRSLLGTQCRLNGDENLGTGWHDPSELYARLMKALNFYPIATRITKNYIADPEYDSPVVMLRDSDVERTFSMNPLHVANEELQVIRWPDTWRSSIDFTSTPHPQDPQRMLSMYSTTSILSADCIVVPLYRGSGEYIQGEWPVVISREVKVNEFFDINIVGGITRRYTLSAVVYLPFGDDVHYVTLLRCGDNWLIYDDMQPVDISQKRVPKAVATNIINHRGVLFFYY